jgi:DNA repair protein RecN (Recombination protein N)
LSEEDFQFKIIDAVAINQSHLVAYQHILKQYKELKTTLDTTKENLALVLKEKDYNEFLFNELNTANLKSGELETLEQSFEALNNVEAIKENLDALLSLANEDNFGLLKSLKEFKSILQKNSSFSETYQSLLERTTSILIEFDDISKELNRESELVYSDPEKLETINQKLQLIYSLQKKHQVLTVEELITIQNDLENKVVSVTALEETILKIEKKISDLEIQLDKKAADINKSRSEAIPKLNEQLIAILNQLGMTNVRFKIEVTASNKYLANGKDNLQFLFSANKGTEFGLLKKVASGGEMSRIMLAVKAVLAQYSKLPTIIFDEIDTGVSGEIANKMGEIMREMSKTMQVFAITHLPQIAAKGSQHFKVFKTISNNTTVSELKLLTNDERINEIAEMLSGKEISDSALNHAKALLN